MDKHRAEDTSPEAEMDRTDAADNPQEQDVGEEKAGAGSARGDEPGRSTAEAPAEGADGSTQSVSAVQDKYLRLAAEFENYRKRSARERQEAGWRAQADLVQGLVESLDDIMRFAHLDPATVDSATVVQGVAIVEKKILKALAGHGLEVVNPVDQLFDPAFHEAVGTEPALAREDDHLIARVYQPGFVFRGQLLRPARVVVRQWLG
jgi:molecular chaperone GrpE